MTSATAALRHSLALAAVGQILDVLESGSRRRTTRWGPDLFTHTATTPSHTGKLDALKGVSAVVPLLNSSRGSIATAGILRGALLARDRRQHRYGLDGSDQLHETINLYVVFAHLILDAESAADLSLRAINAQIAISYLSSGVVKAVSPEWRSGHALIRVARTRAYGNSWAAETLEKRSGLAVALSWGTIAGEALFPLAYLLPLRYARIAMSVPLAFHLGTAHYMGLPRFFWAFAAGHPALRYVCATRTRRKTA